VQTNKDWEGGREAHDALVEARLRSLWQPLPEVHPRVQLWMPYSCDGTALGVGQVAPHRVSRSWRMTPSTACQFIGMR
jgi:hypothetical protein